MKKHLIFSLIGLIFSLAPHFLRAQSEEMNTREMMATLDSINNSFKWQTGSIVVKEGLATVNVPAGFKFLNGEQSRFVLEKLCGNPPDDSTLGMLFPEKSSPIDSSVFAFNLSFDELGYVKDDDADKIDYTDLMKNMQKEASEANAERVKQGYEPVTIIGWASQPFYDKDKKVLHWAKEIQFGEQATGPNTLNYDVRVLGRKGVLSMNAVGSMGALPLVKQSIDGIVSSVQFQDGQKYGDFDASIDKVAAWTIGGLVAGKILAKVGLWALVLKFIKPIILAIGAAGAGLVKLFKKKEVE